MSDQKMAERGKIQSAGETVGVTVGRKIEEYLSVQQSLAPGTDVLSFFLPGFLADRAGAKNTGYALGGAGSKVMQFHSSSSRKIPGFSVRFLYAGGLRRLGSIFA
jgi:hypothetical protein